MKINKNKSLIVLGISVVALFVATNSATMCGLTNFKAGKMSKSLYKFD